MDTETFIRSCAANNLSKTATMQALGISRGRFALMLECLPDIKWPERGQSIDFWRAMQDRRGTFTDALRASHKLAMEARRKQRLHSLPDGRQGSIEEFVRDFKSPVSACAVRRRLKKGWPILDALQTPRTSRHDQLRPHQKSAWQ